MSFKNDWNAYETYQEANDEDINMRGSPSTTTPRSILMSSSNYTTNHNLQSSTRKRVTIVSPIKWHSDTEEAIARKRQFIKRELNYKEIQFILQNILKIQLRDAMDSYEDCVQLLLSSQWIPDQTIIRRNDSLRAKPTVHESEKHIICTDIEYLSTFSTQRLKKWITDHGIPQPMNGSKYDYMQVIRNAYPFVSPGPCDFVMKFNQEAGNEDHKKTMCRTPHRQHKAKEREGVEIRKQLDFEEDW
eukprot:88160_1